MQQHLILWPMLAQIAVPIVVLLLNGKRKREDVLSGQFDREKAAMDNEAWGRATVLTSKNLANQFQFPVIFYVLCLSLAFLDAVSTSALIVACLSVACRYVHAYVHVSNNFVPARLRSFIASTLLLMILFGMTVYALMNV